MPAILTPQQWRGQPQFQVGVAKFSGLDRVWSAASFSEPQVVSGSAAQARAINEQGRAIDFSGGASGNTCKIQLGGSYGGTGTDITFVMVYRRTTTPPQYPVFLTTSDGSGGMQLACDDPGNQDQIHVGRRSVATTTSGLLLSTFSGAQCVVATYRRSDGALFFAQRELSSGALRTASASSGAGGWNAGTGQQAIGDRAHGQMNMGAILWRNLTQAEAVQLSANPWQLFAPRLT